MTDFTLNNCLFISAKPTKNVDPNKYIYSGYNMASDSCSKFSITEGSMGKNVLFL